LDVFFKCTNERNFFSGGFQLLISRDYYHSYRNLSLPPTSIPKLISDGNSQLSILTVEEQTFQSQGHKCHSAGVQKEQNRVLSTINDSQHSGERYGE